MPALSQFYYIMTVALSIFQWADFGTYLIVLHPSRFHKQIVMYYNTMENNNGIVNNDSPPLLR